MGIFGRRRQRERADDDTGPIGRVTGNGTGHAEYAEFADEGEPYGDYGDYADYGDHGGYADYGRDYDEYGHNGHNGHGEYTDEPGGDDRRPYGPFDIAEAPDDRLTRIDLGSVRVPVPEGARVVAEKDPGGKIRGVFVVTSHGRVEINAYAAPRSGGLWRQVSTELAEQLRSDGASVTSGLGEWGIELSAILNELALRFVGVDGPRWMLRGVIVGPQSLAAQAPTVLRDIVRGTVVVRGDAPMPVSAPLPIRTD